MKKILKDYKTYLIILGLVLVGYLPFIISVILFNNGAPFLYYSYIEWSVMALYLIIGYLSGDQIIANYQRRNTDINNVEIPEGIKNYSNFLKFIFFISALGIALLCLSLELYSLLNGCYPFTKIV